jgi:hypothetical protein
VISKLFQFTTILLCTQFIKGSLALSQVPAVPPAADNKPANNAELRLCGQVTSIIYAVRTVSSGHVQATLKTAGASTKKTQADRVNLGKALSDSPEAMQLLMRSLENKKLEVCFSGYEPNIGFLTVALSEL